MYTPTARLLTILELLQARGRIQGSELAERLEVNGRTVRRYITTLQDLGIPIEAERGRYGAYRLRAGYKLPPLLFTDDEALALTVGLLAARELGLAAAAPAVEGALAKLERVLPLPVREQVQAVADTLHFDVWFPNLSSSPAEPPSPAVDGDAIAALSIATQRHRRVQLRYRTPGAAEERERLIDPYGLVYRSGRTYVIGYCHLRDDVRVFRLDRVREVTLTEDGFDRPADFDPQDYLIQTLATMPREWPVEVLLELPLSTAQERVPPGAATLTETLEGVILRCHTSNLEYFSHVLLSLRCPLVVRQPPELRDALRQWADYAAALAGRTA